MAHILQMNINQLKIKTTTNYNDFGVAGGRQKEGERLYDSAYRQTFNNNKNHIERTNMGNAKMFNPYINANLKDSTRENNRQHAVYDPSTYTPNQQILEQMKNYHKHIKIIMNQEWTVIYYKHLKIIHILNH